MSRTVDEEIVKFIIAHVEDQPLDIGRSITAKFGVTRQTSSNYLSRLVREGVLIASGMTTARRYDLAVLTKIFEETEITPDMEDDFIWRRSIRPKIEKYIPKNVLDICQYGFTEMFNNVIDHSGSETCVYSCERTAKDLEFWLIDKGVGIFEKIRSAFNLSDPRHALLELSKGKLTTAAEKHSGEEIFFTSRMMDRFVLSANGLVYAKRRSDDGWLVEVDDIEDQKGTSVRLAINVDATHTIKEVFDKFSAGEDYSFAKTHVPLQLAKYEGENLVSRSQARRLLVRVDRFTEVLLDFENIDEIGQAFADEIFRVFATEHPEIRIATIRTNENIDSMIRRAKKRAKDR